MDYKKAAKARKGELGLSLRSQRERLGISLLDFWAITDWDTADVSNFERNKVNEDMELSTYLKVLDLLIIMQGCQNQQDFIAKMDKN